MPKDNKSQPAASSDQDLLVFDLVVAGRKYHEDLYAQAHFECNPDGVNAALTDSSMRYAHWATLAVFAKELVEELEEKVVVLKANLMEQFEAQLGKVTLAREAVNRDPKMATLTEQLRDAKRNLRLIDVGVGTITRRQDSVMEVARNLRGELDAFSVKKPRSIKAKGQSAEAKMDRIYDD